MNRLHMVTIVLGIAGMVGGPALDLSPTTAILMENGSPYYVPAAATAVSGTPIRWENPTPTHHTVTHNGCVNDENACLFNSGTVPPGGEFTIPGLPPGRYAYHCGIHPIMRGQLIVIEEVSTPAHL